MGLVTFWGFLHLLYFFLQLFYLVLIFLFLFFDFVELLSHVSDNNICGDDTCYLRFTYIYFFIIHYFY